MAVLTSLSLPEAARILEVFGVGEVLSIEPLTRGSVNSNFAVETSRTGRIFVRIFEEQGQEGAARETRLLAHLAAAGVASPAPLRAADGSSFVMHGQQSRSRPLAAFPWIAGEELCQARVTPGAAARVGAALAQLHRAGAGFEGCGAGRFTAADLLRRIDGLPGDAVPEGQALLDELRADLAEPLPALPHGVIHGDLFRDNVLWSPEGTIAALLDFESASEGLFAYDLAVTILAWTFGDRFDPTLVRALVEAYDSGRSLALEERRALPRLARRAATRFVVTRITDFFLRPEAHARVKDYRRFLARRDTADAALAAFV